MQHILKHRHTGSALVAGVLIMIEAVALGAYYMPHVKTSGSAEMTGTLLVMSIAALFCGALAISDLLGKKKYADGVARPAAFSFGIWGIYCAIAAALLNANVQQPNLQVVMIFFGLCVASFAFICAATRMMRMMEEYEKKKPCGLLFRWNFFAACAVSIALYPHLSWYQLLGLVAIQLISWYRFAFDTNLFEVEKVKQGHKKKRRTRR